MKLPEVLEQAIKGADWKKVCAVYTAITGKKIEPPKPKLIIPDYVNMDIDLGSEDFNKFAEQVKEEAGEDALDEEEVEPITLPSEEEVTVDEASDFIQSASKKKSDPASKAGVVAGSQSKVEPIAISKRKNKFKDNLAVASMHTRKVNPKLNLLYGDGSARMTRDLIEGSVDTGATVDVQCSLCDKEESVSPILGRGYSTNPDENTYRCNVCCTPKGQLQAARRNRG